MTADAVREALRSRRPFKVKIADGRSIDIPHPEFAAITQSGRLLIIAIEKDRIETVDVTVITGLEQEAPLPV
jgi:hypothetical protein